MPALLSMRMLTVAGQQPAACLVVTSLVEQRRRRDELEALVGERTAELAQRNRDLEEFASVISHDLQEPLRKVQKFGDLLNRNIEGDLSETELDYIRRMQEASIRMSKMIDGLLALSRIATRSIPYQEVDLNLSVRDALSNLETSLEKSGGQVRIEPLPTIEAEPIQMQQMLQNLVGNALKFHRPGVAPIVMISSRHLPGAAQKPARVEIRVEDNGIGFDDRYIDLLFQPFKRLVGRKGEYEGSGMGLAICKKIVERHKGEITCRSTPGSGSVFLVTLPVQQI
jgi:signal transduction histidine kinase